MSQRLRQATENAQKRLLVVLERIEDVFVALGMVGLFVMMVLITANAVGRYQFGRPITGTTEVTELYFMPMIIFLIAASLQRREGNVKVDLLYRDFRESRQTIIDLVSRAITLLIFALIAYGAADQAWDAYLSGRRVLGPIQFPLSISWGIMAFGLATFCVRLLIQIAGDVREVVSWR